MAAWLDFATRGRGERAGPPTEPVCLRTKPDLAALAAACAFGLARDHPFQDGNKRIAFLTAVVFLGLNGYDLEVSDEDVIVNIVALAAGRLTEAKLAAWIRRHMRPTPTGAA
jgi:death-on-curing protein